MRGLTSDGDSKLGLRTLTAANLAQAPFSREAVVAFSMTSA
ncbi:UNVERIFIED_ORG: hypothetical protein CLV66_113127 [Actinomadura viridilutea]